MDNKITLWGWEKKKRTMLRFIKVGDIFCFQHDENTFCFGRIISIMEKRAIIAEIFDYTSDTPIITEKDINNAVRMFPPVNLDVYSLFDRKIEGGEWRIIGRCEDFTLKDADNIFFTFGYPQIYKMDIWGNKTKISKEEAEGLTDFVYRGNGNIKKLVEDSFSLSGRCAPPIIS